MTLRSKWDTRLGIVIARDYGRMSRHVESTGTVERPVSIDTAMLAIAQSRTTTNRDCLTQQLYFAKYIGLASRISLGRRAMEGSNEKPGESESGILAGLAELDRILRGELTRVSSLRRGGIEISPGRLSLVIVVLAMIYGICMGTFAVSG